jgi:DNA-binding CsgD family transcriptional regulator
MDVQDARRSYDRVPRFERLAALAEAMLAARSIADTDAALRHLRDVFGLAYCRYEARFPVRGRLRELQLVAGDAPDASGRLAKAQDDAMDKVNEHSRLSVCPMLWHDPEPAEGAGPVLNIAIPLAGRVGDFAALHAWGDPAEEIQIRELLPDLHWGALHLHDAVRQVTVRESGAPAERLTPRETECLRWIAKGKTSWETAQILQVTEYTVIFHANNAMRKLGVNARAAAVQRAMSLGYI